MMRRISLFNYFISFLVFLPKLKSYSMEGVSGIAAFVIMLVWSYITMFFWPNLTH